MIRKRHSRVPVLVTLALVGAASGCEIVASFNRDLIPTDVDSGVSYDASYPDGGGEPDVALPDSGGSDVTAAETSTPLDGGPDGGQADSALDATPGDSSVPDGADTSVPEASVPDTSVPETSVPDTSVPDTSVPDTSAPVDSDVDASDDGG